MTNVYLIKLVIETTSPMAIYSGAAETAFDNQLARDANGLPYIPATTIAGVWGHLIEAAYGKEVRDKWLGSTEQSSSLVISHGVIHDRKDQPVSPLISPDEIKRDVILKPLIKANPMHRERVAINDRGVAREQRKFDQILLPKGIRFSLHLKWTDAKRADKKQLTDSEWQQLLSLWLDRRLAFGASTRNGLGQISIIRCEQARFDLSDGPETGQAIQQFLSQEVKHDLQIQKNEQQQTRLLASLPLKAVDNWRCGQGSTLLSTTPYKESSVAAISYSEPQIEWQNGGASVTPPKAILCGSSVKGILAHRIAYHLRRHQQKWAETIAESGPDIWQATPPEMAALFGQAADKNGEGRAGALYVDDVAVSFDPEQMVIRHHNRIDRFTGGVRAGALYTEELLYKPEFTLRIWLRSGTVISPALRAAVADTLEDLRVGLLPFGAGSGRGNSLVMADNRHSWEVNLDAFVIEPETKKEAEEING